MQDSKTKVDIDSVSPDVEVIAEISVGKKEETASSPEKLADKIGEKPADKIVEKLEKTEINEPKSWADEVDDEPEPVIEIKEVSGLIESVHNVEVKLADQQSNEASPLYSVHSFEELGL